MPLWDATLGQRRLLYQKHQTIVAQVVWLPDGHRLASADVGGLALVWNGANGQTLFAYQKHHAPITRIAWSPGGRYIATIDQPQQVASCLGCRYGSDAACPKKCHPVCSCAGLVA